jgi:3-methyladenine DNA glycosylase AlkD
MTLQPASTASEVVAYLASLTDDEARANMARFGIDPRRSFGIPHSVTKPLARQLKRNHPRALELFATGRREAQLIAGWTADPKLMTIETARAWAADFSSWEVVDGIADLFLDCAFWREFIIECARDDREFVKRTAFTMMAMAAIQKKEEPRATFDLYLEMIEGAAEDDRNFVKKAVNWALRFIGKRSAGLHSAAVTLAEQLAQSENKTSRWIGKDALRDLASEATKKRLARWPAPD